MNNMSQEEIDAIMAGAAGGEVSNNAPMASSAMMMDLLSAEEIDGLGEIGNISMGTAATTLSTLLGKKVNINTPTVSVDTVSTIRDQYPMPYIVVEVGYTVGINGNNILGIQANDAIIIANLMMGGNGIDNLDPDLNEMQTSAVGEAMNQMMGSVATSLSSMVNKKIDISPPAVRVIDLSAEGDISSSLDKDEPIVKISFRMEVENLIDSEIMQILPLDVAKELYNDLKYSMVADMDGEPMPAVMDDPVAPPAPAPVAPPPPAPAAAPSPAMPQPGYDMPQGQPMAQPGYGMPQGQPMMQPGYGMPQGQPMMQPGYSMPQGQPMMQPGYGMPQGYPTYGHTAVVANSVPVQNAQFVPLTNEPVEINASNIGLIKDVPLQVTVELGRTRKSIREILDFSVGSIIELDKLAGEPVDVHVNGQLTAKGEVVVIDENFGVRITEIVSPLERVQRL